MSGVVFDSAGNFYGATLLGGANGNGTVYEAKRSGKTWTESVIYSFTGGSDAINPVATVSLDAQGNLYGTAPAGGAYGNGAVYKLSRSSSGWTESVLYSFQAANDGANPVGGVILDKAGNLYGSKVPFFGASHVVGDRWVKGQDNPFATAKDWQAFWSTAGATLDNLSFQGGDLHARREKDSWDLRPTDFRQLRLDPPRADGTADLGAPADVPTPFGAE